MRNIHYHYMATEVSVLTYILLVFVVIGVSLISFTSFILLPVNSHIPSETVEFFVDVLDKTKQHVNCNNSSTSSVNVSTSWSNAILRHLLCKFDSSACGQDNSASLSAMMSLPSPMSSPSPSMSTITSGNITDRQMREIVQRLDIDEISCIDRDSCNERNGLTQPKSGSSVASCNFVVNDIIFSLMRSCTQIMFHSIAEHTVPGKFVAAILDTKFAVQQVLAERPMYIRVKNTLYNIHPEYIPLANNNYLFVYLNKELQKIFTNSPPQQIAPFIQTSGTFSIVLESTTPSPIPASPTQKDQSIVREFEKAEKNQLQNVVSFNAWLYYLRALSPRWVLLSPDTSELLDSATFFNGKDPVALTITCKIKMLKNGDGSLTSLLNETELMNLSYDTIPTTVLSVVCPAVQDLSQYKIADVDSYCALDFKIPDINGANMTVFLPWDKTATLHINFTSTYLTVNCIHDLSQPSVYQLKNCNENLFLDSTKRVGDLMLRYFQYDINNVVVEDVKICNGIV